MSNNPLPGQIYRHFKGNLYQIVTLAEHSETGEKLVVYQALYGEFKVYARHLSMFFEKVDEEKYSGAEQEYRFELQRDLAGVQAMLSEEESSGESAVIKDRTSDPVSVPGNEIPGEASARGERGAEEASDEAVEIKEEQEELNIDPLVMDFLDARTYRERLKILSALHPCITDDMINVMAIAVDVEIEDGDTEKRFEELRTCLMTFERYESKSSRLRQL